MKRSTLNSSIDKFHNPPVLLQQPRHHTEQIRRSCWTPGSAMFPRNSESSVRKRLVLSRCVGVPLLLQLKRCWRLTDIPSFILRGVQSRHRHRHNRLRKHSAPSLHPLHPNFSLGERPGYSLLSTTVQWEQWCGTCVTSERMLTQTVNIRNIWMDYTPPPIILNFIGIWEKKRVVLWTQMYVYIFINLYKHFERIILCSIPVTGKLNELLRNGIKILDSIITATPCDTTSVFLFSHYTPSVIERFDCQKVPWNRRWSVPSDVLEKNVDWSVSTAPGFSSEQPPQHFP